MNTDYPFNQGFEEWYSNYAKRLKENNMDLIQSISMESVDARSHGGNVRGIMFLVQRAGHLLLIF